MTLRLPTDPLLRAQRKQNLLLASELARTQVVVAAEELGWRADVAVRVAIVARAWAFERHVWTIGGAVASALTLGALLRVRSLRLMRWASLGLRVARIALRWMAARRPAAAG